MVESATRPVSQSLRVRRLDPDPRGYNDRIGRAIAAIDRVHLDGQLPLIPVEWRQLDLDTQAFYDFVRFGDQSVVPQRIVLSTTVRRPGLALLFEVGHLLDQQALGDAGTFASPAHPRLAPWRQAVVAARAVAEIHRLHASDAFPSLTEHFEYLSRVDELWERSYAQYVAVRSGEIGLLAELNERRTRASGLHIPYLWDDRDFAPVAAAIDNLFRELGWTH